MSLISHMLQILSDRTKVALRRDIETDWVEFFNEAKPSVNENDLDKAISRICDARPQLVHAHRHIIKLLSEESGTRQQIVASEILRNVEARILENEAREEYRKLKQFIESAELHLTSADAERKRLREFAPPGLAEFFVGLLSKKRYRNGLLQSLDEDFQNDLSAGVSLRRAQLRYWAAALNSTGPQLWAAVRRIGLIGIVADYIRAKLG